MTYGDVVIEMQIVAFKIGALSFMLLLYDSLGKTDSPSDGDMVPD